MKCERCGKEADSQEANILLAIFGLCIDCSFNANLRTMLQSPDEETRSLAGEFVESQRIKR